MAKLSPLTVVVAFDISDDERRSEVREYLVDVLGAKRRTKSVYEFVYDPPPDYPTIVQDLSKMIRPQHGDRLYLWDLEAETVRRIAAHQI